MKLGLAILATATLLYVSAVNVSLAQEDTTSAPHTLDTEIEDLKKALISLNRDLFLLEQDLLYPASTQVAVYLSVDTGTYFSLDAIELMIDNQEVTHYLYTDRQVDALHRGGIQRLFMGNVSQGEHELTASFVGYDAEGRAYKRNLSQKFEKTGKPAVLELKIRDHAAEKQPEFTATVL